VNPTSVSAAVPPATGFADLPAASAPPEEARKMRDLRVAATIRISPMEAQMVLKKERSHRWFNSVIITRRIENEREEIIETTGISEEIETSGEIITGT
jgi:hypothetical protein